MASGSWAAVMLWVASNQQAPLDAFLGKQAAHQKAVFAVRIQKLDQRPERIANALMRSCNPASLASAFNASFKTRPFASIRASAGCCFQNVEHLHGRRHRSNFAAEREAEEYIFEYLHHIRPADHAGDRESVAHRFAEASHVRSHAKSFLRAAQPKVKATCRSRRR